MLAVSRSRISPIIMMFGACAGSSQGSREGHADFGVHLHLVDAGHLIFDRLFHSDHFAVRFIDVIETSVKRGRFPEPVGPVTKTIPSASLIIRSQRFLIVGEKSKLWQARALS